MSGVKGKTIIKLLLITMVIQPVAFSYAMASMDHGHHHTHSSVFDHAGDYAVDDGMAPEHHHDDHDGKGGTDSCCLTPACSPASVMCVFETPILPSSNYIEATITSLISIYLPAEIKPPRSLLG